MDKKYTKGSIITVSYDSVKTISIVDNVDNQYVICGASICSTDNDVPFRRTRDILQDYSGEKLSDVRLITAEEFDDMVDSNLIDKKLLVNVNV